MKRLVHLACLGLWLASSAAGQTDGIFADFSTSHGAFTVFLDHERAPRAVASFVGLATGASSWADPDGNIWERPFYNGSIFHRIFKAGDTRIAIQGGGIAYCGITFTNLQAGPAVSDSGGFTVITTNAPGVTTNNFLSGPVPFTTENAAAVPTSYTYGMKTVATNAPVVTRTVISLFASASNATKYVVNSYTAESWYTNYTVLPVETTQYGSIFTVTTNLGATPEVLTHRVVVSMASTGTILGPVVNTNFANAGYYMLDSATNGLVHSNGVISMANSGPNTDGSQFFITATNWSSGDGSYTVFGHVTTGMDVVNSIAAVAVEGAGSRPIGDVVLSNVVIRRVGAAAAAFDIAAQGVPVVEFAPIRVVATGAQAQVTVEIPARSECLFRVSTNGLVDWSVVDWGYATNDATEQRVVLTNTGSRAFFHAVRTRHADAWTAPTSYTGRILHFYWDTDPITYYVAAFTNSTGTWTKSQGTNSQAGGLFSYPYAPYWTGLPYSAKLYFADNLAQYSYSLWFDPGKVTNRFTGTMAYWAGGAYILSGVFTVE